MPDDFRPASRGEPVFPRLTANWFSGVNRAVNTLRGGDVDLANQQLAHAAENSYVTVRVVNKSGSPIDRPGGVLAPETINFPYADRPRQVFDKPIVKGIAPSGVADNIVILTRPLKNNQPGTGVVVGFVFCRLDYTDEDKEHEFAVPASGVVDHLVSSVDGEPIFWREKEDLEGENTTGQQWALVLLSGGGDRTLSVLSDQAGFPGGNGGGGGGGSGIFGFHNGEFVWMDICQWLHTLPSGGDDAAAVIGMDGEGVCKIYDADDC